MAAAGRGEGEVPDGQVRGVLVAGQAVIIEQLA